MLWISLFNSGSQLTRPAENKDDLKSLLACHFNPHLRQAEEPFLRPPMGGLLPRFKSPGSWYVRYSITIIFLFVSGNQTLITTFASCLACLMFLQSSQFHYSLWHVLTQKTWSYHEYDAPAAKLCLSLDRCMLLS